MAAVGGLLAVIGTALAVVMSVGWPTRSPFALLAALIPAVVGLVGYGLLIWLARTFWRRRQLGAATLTLPQAEPLALGSAVTARFRRAGGSRRPLGPARLAAYLVCTERATYRQGTDTHTATQEVRRHELDAWVDGAEAVSGRLTVVVPVDAPPSMALNHNKIVWTVRVDVMVAGVPDGTAVFPVAVLPVVVAR